MCEPSKVTDDWVIKGCHIHVDGVELAVFTNQHGKIAFRAVFSSTSQHLAAEAIRTVLRDCLPNEAIRTRWIQRLESARVYMLGYPGELNRLANGRMLEFKYLRIAIERWVK